VVLVISEFRVANGMEEAVRQAFADRPRLVEDAPGFIGMEVLVDREDGSRFQLLTRWIDEASFQRWHKGPSHHLSHRDIPKGLKLDAAYTVVRTFEVFSGAATTGTVPPISNTRHLLARSRSLHWLQASLDGRIAAANPAFESLLQEVAGGLAGRSLLDLLTQPDAASVQAILTSGGQDSVEPVLLNFVDRSFSIRTLACWLEIRDQDFVLLGEPVPEHEHALSTELLELNNQWSLLVRENEKNVKALHQAKKDLEHAIKELRDSHWHLRKISETLPICMFCGKVRTGESRWQDVAEYLKANSLFLSHGCCPACVEQLDGWKVE
jgi:heme-degrading monooxygenase HmoA